MRKFYYLWLLALFTCWQLNAQGNTCASPIVISSVPYTTTDNTSNYGDDYNNGDSSCSSYYLSGDDVVYSYTPALTGTYNVLLSNLTATYSGVFVLDGCLDATTSTCVGFAGSSNTVDRSLNVNLTAGTTYYIVISTWASPQSVGYQLDLTLLSTCISPSDLSVSNITSNSAEISWTAGAGQTQWDYVVQAPGTGTPTSGTGTSSNPTTVSPLASATSYEVYVRAVCGTETSAWVGPVNFTTACDAYTPTYPQDFATWVPVCWTEYSNGDPTTGPTNPGSGDWQADGWANSGSTGAAKVNLYNANTNDWIVSPTIDLTTGGPYRLVYDVGLFAYAGSGFRALGSDDQLQVLISTDNGVTWTNLMTYDAMTTFPDGAASTTEFIDLTAYSGSNVIIGYWATEGTVDDAPDVDVMIDNFVVEEIPSCSYPTNLAGSIVDGSSAMFTWTAGGTEPTWEWAIVPTGDPAPTTGTSVSEAMVTANMLTPGTTYDFYVRANCGPGNNSEWVMTTLVFDYCTSVPTSNDNSGITNVNFQGTDTAVADVTYLDNTATVTDVNQGQYTQMTITFGTGYTYDTNIWIDFNDNLQFETSELVYDSVSLAANPTDLNTSFEIPAGAPLGQHRMRIGTADSGQGTPNPCYSGTYGVTIDWTVNVVEPSMTAVDNGYVSALVVTGTTTAVTSIETCQSLDVLVQANEPGVTDADTAAAGANLVVWVAYSSDNTDPSTWANALWMPATYTQDVGSNDEFSLSIEGLAAGTYYIASRFQLDNGVYVYGGNGGIYDGTTYNNAEIMVVDPMAVTATSDVTGVCLGDSASLTAASDDSTYTYEWDNEAGTGATVTVTPTETTTYTVTGTNGAGCTATSSITIVVNPLPAAVTVTPSPAVVCEGGDPVELVAEGGMVTIMETEGFETAPPAGWSFYQSESDDPGFVQTDDRAHSGTYSYYHNDDNIAAESDSWMMTPGYPATAGSSFDFWYNHNYTPTYYVYSGIWVSTTGSDPVANPSDWTELQELTGSEDTWTEVNLDLSSYAGQTVYLAFKYSGDWDHELYIDDCTFTAEQSGTLAWSPATGLFTDAAGTVAYTGENLATVYALPSADTTYTVTATTSAGCESTADVMVTVNAAPSAPTAELIQEFCPDNAPTVGDLVATGNEITWYDAATGGNMLAATDLLADGTAYYAQDTSTDGCTSLTRTTVVVDFDASLCPSNNNDCADAESLTVDATAISGNTNNTSDEMNTTCSSTMTDGVWYTVVGDGADLTVTVSPNGWDAQLAVLEGDCAGGFTCNGGADAASVSGTESYTFPSTAGTTYYILVGTNDSLSEGEFAIQVTTNLGITDIENVDSSITIYPNPVSDILNINVDQGIKVLQVFNSNGSLVKESTTVSDNSINVHTLETGTYVLRVILEDHTVVTEKFIKR